MAVRLDEARIRSLTANLLNGGVALNSLNYGDYALPLAGGKMTGTIHLGSTGLRTHDDTHGYYTDQYGNFFHCSNTSTDSWNVHNAAGNISLKYYFETGALEIPTSLKMNTWNITDDGTCIYFRKGSNTNCVAFDWNSNIAHIVGNSTSTACGYGWYNKEAAEDLVYVGANIQQGKLSYFWIGKDYANLWMKISPVGRAEFMSSADQDDHNGIIKVINNSTYSGTGYHTVIRAMAPNATGTQLIMLGPENSVANAGYMGFYNTGTSSSLDNRLSFGLYAVDNVLNIMGNGKVGVGTITPSTKFVVYSEDTAESVATFATSGANPWIYFKNNGTTKVASVGYYNNMACLSNEKNLSRIGVTDTGIPQYWTDSAGTAKYEIILGNAYENNVGPLRLKRGPGINNATNNYISAGRGYSTGSGLNGLKLIVTEQDDAVSGLGQDCLGKEYELSVAAALSTSNNGYITFVGHKKATPNTYSELGHFNFGSSVFYVNGKIGIGTTSPAQVLEVNGITQSKGLLVCNRGSAANTGSYLNSAIEVREYNFGGSQEDTWGIAPRLSFHWSGRVAAQIGLASNGYLYVNNNAVASTTFSKIVLEDNATWGISITGNAGTATTLQTARTLTIGNTGKSFNGGGDLSWTIPEIGASYGHANWWSFAEAQHGNYVTFDASNPSGGPGGWVNGFVTTHNHYLSSFLVNKHRTSDWWVGYSEHTDTTAVNPTWHKLLHSSNYSSYALPLTGGTLSGLLKFSNALTNVNSPTVVATFINNDSANGIGFAYTNSLNVNSAAIPAGFASRATTSTWGAISSSSYTLYTEWDAGAGSNPGAIAFMAYPAADKVSVKIDGYYYQNEGAYMCLDTNNYSSYALPKAGGTMNASAAIKFPATAGSIATSDPMAITYGRIAAYGTLCINANTDNSGTEYVILTAGKGHSSATADGLAVGTSTLTWQGADVVTSSNYSSWMVPKSGGTFTGKVAISYAHTGGGMFQLMSTGSNEASMDYAAGGTSYWVVGKGCGGTGNGTFAWYYVPGSKNVMTLTSAGALAITTLTTTTINMGGNINLSNMGTCYIGNGPSDTSPTVGGALANLVISSWYGISFTTSCAVGYQNKTAIGFDCRTGTIRAAAVYGAVWNDYAEYRITTTKVKPGRVVVENNNDTLSMSTERLMPGANIVSDTFGFAIGETDEAKTPLAVSGRVLAYPLEPREEYHAGDPVCSGPNGTVSKMTREEVMMYPDRIIGTVSAVPNYDTWGTGNVDVNGRIWIKVR